MKQYDLIIMANENVARHTWKLTLNAPNVLVNSIKPGQFVHIAIPSRKDLQLRRPISIFDCDYENGRLSLVYAVKGAGTQALSTLHIGQAVNVIAPLGKPFPEYKDVFLLGGGAGIAPLNFTSKLLPGCTAFYGWANSGLVYGINEAKKYCKEVNIYTDDGSMGEKGFAIAGMLEKLKQHKPEAIFACGPLPMFKALKAAKPDVPCYVSLEERMGCGVGACLACACKIRVKDGEEYKRVCSDGPVFNLEDIIYD